MSGFLKVNWRDIVKGVLLAVLVPVLTTILQTLQAGSWVIDWKTIGIVAASSFLSYILKQLATDDTGKLGGKI